MGGVAVVGRLGERDFKYAEIRDERERESVSGKVLLCIVIVQRLEEKKVDTVYEKERFD